MRPLVVFCGREFISASQHVSKLLSSRQGLITRIVEQAKVPEALADKQFTHIIAVPLMCRLSGDLIGTAPNLKLIHQWGVGLEGVDIEAASELGIPVANTPSSDLTAQATAEQGVKLLLDIARLTYGHPKETSVNENWGNPRGDMLSSRRLGVVGHQGAVGSRVFNILRNGFGVDAVGIGRSELSLSQRMKSIQRLDGLILTPPLTPQTRNMVNDEVFEQLNPGSLVVNVGRGPIVDREALIRALERDPNLRFGTDVWWQEPPDFQGDPLLKHPRIVVSPHIGGLTKQGSITSDERCAQGILDFLDGKMPKYTVNVHRLTQQKAKENSEDRNQPTTRTASELIHSQVHPPTRPRPSGELTKQVYQELSTKFPHSRLTMNATELLRRGTDESLHDPVAPDICVMPESNEEVAFALKICSKYNYPVVPFGRGTSLEGGVSALAGGLSIDLSQMNRVLSVNNKDFECLVQAGVSRLQLNQELKPTGLFFPVDPGADATLGGMASTRASGTTAVRYGTMRDRVMGLTVVLPSGEIIKTGSRALKSSAGYDLTGLFVGSEGTLGIITEVRLKLAPVPEALCSAVAQFKDVESAVNTVIELKQLGVPVARAEFLDPTTMRAVRQAGINPSSSEMVDLPSLFLEFHGSSTSVFEQSALAKSVGGAMLVSYQESVQEEERNRLWRARHNAYYSVMKLRPAGTKGWPTDVCVPVSRLAECITSTYEDVQRSNLIAPIFGHIGDGNFHCILLYNLQLDGADGLLNIQRFNDRLVKRALDMEGTCTGEHGIGYGKKSWLEIEHGPGAVALMRQLKRAVDPKNIMNPGKVI